MRDRSSKRALAGRPGSPLSCLIIYDESRSLMTSAAFHEAIGLPYLMALGPSRRDGATLCSRARMARDLIAARHDPEGRWSGWFFGCASVAHDHATDDYEPVLLFELVRERPHLLTLLALPPGSVFSVLACGEARELDCNGHETGWGFSP